jgi:hypothetical protein
MNNEYVIINKTEWLKVMETNQKPAAHYDGIYVSEAQNARADLIEDILSKSTPLIPEIEKAFDAGGVFCFNVNIDKKYDGDKQDYITNLKLDI